MGYTTTFSGSIAAVPALTAEETAYLRKFNETRRMDRVKGPYFVGGSGFHGQGSDGDIRDHNTPAEGQPGLWCQWVPTEDGSAIVWDGGEKFYDSAEWMTYLIEHFIGSDPKAKSELPFLQGHTLNGEIIAQGESFDDRWRLVVTNNVVETRPIELTGKIIECPNCEHKWEAA